MNAKTLLLAAALMLSVAAAFAQEEIAPGSRSPDPRERARPGRIGERLLRPGGIVDRLTERLGDAGEDLDVAKLDDAIDSLLAPLIDNSPLIDDLWFDLRADRTDFANDRLGASAGIAIGKSPWSNLPTRLALDLSTHLAESAQGRREIHVRASLDLDTDVLPLVNFALPRLREKLATAAAQAASEADADFLQALHEELDRVDAIHSMDELADLFANVSAARLAAANRDVERKRAAADRISVEGALSDGAASDDARRVAADALLQSRLDRDRLFATRPRIERDAYGEARELRVTIENSDPSNGLHVDAVELTIAQDGIRAAAELSIGKGVEWYELSRPLAVGMLRRLQNGDPATTTALREAIAQRLSDAQAVLTEPNRAPTKPER